MILVCLEVVVASARAVIRPIIVTSSAAIFSEGDIVMICVFDGTRFAVIINPAIMLPHARRPIGPVTAG